MKYFRYWGCGPLGAGASLSALMLLQNLVVLAYSVKRLILECPQDDRDSHNRGTCLLPHGHAVFLVVVSVVCALANVDLLVGIWRRDRRFLWPWLATYGLLWVTLTVLFFVDCAGATTVPVKDGATKGKAAGTRRMGTLIVSGPYG